QHLVGAIADEHLVGAQAVQAGDGLAQRQRLRVGVQAQALVQRLAHARQRQRRRRVRVLVGVELDPAAALRLLARDIGVQAADRRAPERRVGRAHASFPATMLSTAMRTAMPKVTCGRITLCGPSATAESISTPRLIGPGCMTMASGLAQRRRSVVRPKLLKYSWLEGSSAPLMRSFCRRSVMTTSQSLMPSSSVWHTRTPRCDRSLGTSVRGPTTRTSGQPSAVSAWMSERATRECTTSPTMATDSLVKSFL